MIQYCYTISRSGMTLLEVFIASAILLVVLGGALASGTSATNYANLTNVDVLALEDSDRARTALYNDASNSAYLPQPNGTDLTQIQGLVPAVNLYPTVNSLTSSGNAGRELRFVKFRTSMNIDDDPNQLIPYTARFGDVNTTYSAVHFDEVGAALTQSYPSPFFILNPSGGAPGVWFVAPVFETSKSIGYLNFSDNVTTTKLRIYRYILVPDGQTVTSLPDTTTGDISNGAAWTSTYPTDTDFPIITPSGVPVIRTGQLLCQYRNPGTGNRWITLGQPLASGIQLPPATPASGDLPLFTITANDPTGTVGYNEIHMRFTLLRPLMANQTWPVISRTVDAVASLKSITFAQ